MVISGDDDGIVSFLNLGPCPLNYLVLCKLTEKDFDNALDDMITAIKEQSLSTLQNLLEHCGKPYLDKSDSEGQTVLHHAVKAADVDILQYLLDQGGDVNRVDTEGCSLLHHLAAGLRTPKQGQICDILMSSGVNTFLLNKKRETALAISLQTDNFELQSLLEPTMYRDSSAIIVKYLNTKPDLPDDVFACLRYIVSKIKCLNPFEKKQTNKVSRNKSLNYRSLMDRGGAISDSCDPYKLKKTVADNNEKITRLKEQIVSLREELVQNTTEHREEIERFEGALFEECENKTAAIKKCRNYCNDTVSILEADLQEAKKVEEDAIEALDDVLQINKRYKLSWVPKSVTSQCAAPGCLKVFRDGFSQHHCRSCGRVFCYNCSIQRLPIPVYGYDSPVRVCSYCYNLLNEEVLCDFDETDIDIDQWNSVHYQDESNTDNLGKKSLFNFGQARSRAGTVTSGYTSGSKSTRSVCGSENWSPSTSSRSSLTSGLEDSEGSGVYSDSDQSTLSNNSTGGTSNSGEISDVIDNLKQAAQKMFKNNSFKRMTQSRK